MNETDLAKVKEFVALLRQRPELREKVKELLTVQSPLLDEREKRTQTNE